MPEEVQRLTDSKSPNFTPSFSDEGPRAPKGERTAKVAEVVA